MLPWNKADFVVITLLGISVAISSIAASEIFSMQASQRLTPAASGPSFNYDKNNSAGLESAPAARAPAPGESTQSLPQGGGAGMPASGPSGGNAQQMSPATSSSAQPQGEDTALLLYRSSPYFMPVTWGAFIGALVWRGKIRTAWSKQGYGYDTFRLVARMKGSPIRVKLLGSVSNPKNRLQLANEFQVDWKTIDNHMQMLEKSGLVEEKGVVGTTKYYSLTEHGKRVLSLLSDTNDGSAASVTTI